MASMREEIVRVARSKKDSTAWMYAVKKDNFAANTNKCNQFVYDVLAEAHVDPLPLVSVWLGLKHRPPTAGEWASMTVQIWGWLVTGDPQPGDVIAEGHFYLDATGHCGIVVGPKETASANANVGGVITINDWGFRDSQHPTFRRLGSLEEVTSDNLARMRSRRM